MFICVCVSIYLVKMWVLHFTRNSYIFISNINYCYIQQAWYSEQQNYVYNQSKYQSFVCFSICLQHIYTCTTYKVIIIHPHQVSPRKFRYYPQSPYTYTCVHVSHSFSSFRYHPINSGITPSPPIHIHVYMYPIHLGITP